MDPTRVLLGNLPPPLCDMLKQSIDKHRDMIVVGEVAEPFGILLATGRTAADVLILALQGSAVPAVCELLLEEYPHLKIVAVAADPGRTILYEMQPHQVPIKGGSAEELLDAIRKVVRNGTF